MSRDGHVPRLGELFKANHSISNPIPLQISLALLLSLISLKQLLCDHIGLYGESRKIYLLSSYLNIKINSIYFAI
jgi:hypothetical protein